MHTIKDMTEIIRIPNIENYIQEIINGELVLTPKKIKKLPDDAYFIAREYYFMGKLDERYTSEMTELNENDEYREFLKRHVGIIHVIKIRLRKQFAKKFDDNAWSELLEEFRNEYKESKIYTEE